MNRVQFRSTVEITYHIPFEGTKGKRRKLRCRQEEMELCAMAVLSGEEYWI